MRHQLFIPLLFLSFILSGQDTLSLKDLSFWKANEAKNWQVVADLSVDLDKDDIMKAIKGTGILANLPDAKNHDNLLSVTEYGDVELSFDFLMARNSNSGFYLQGRYEVQLLDSWGQQHPNFGDCAGVYARRRWNPEAQLFDGHAPRLNACLAPGLWQHLEINFQAPRFDASGKKTANARLLKVVLNGAVVQENIELSGPTGGPVSEQEVAKGPFMIQGDHGPVAFRNFKVENKGGEPVTAGKFTYKLITSNITYPMDFAGKKIDKEGTTDKLTWELAGKEFGFALLFNGNINCPKSGKHHIVLQAGGMASVKIDGAMVVPNQWTNADNQRSANVDLAAGTHTIEIMSYKSEAWMKPFLGLWIEGPESRAAELHSIGSTLALDAPDPILMDAKSPRVFRSFMDINLPNSVRGEKDFLHFGNPHRKRVVHAIQVGDPLQLHYTYDLDNGAVVQIWKGGFLNTSPMWDDRGDGSSRPIGAVLALDDIQTIVSKTKLFDMTTAQNDPVEGFKPHGYDLDEMGYPTFRYSLGAAEIEDQIRISAGKMLNRTLTISNPGKDGEQVLRLAVGKKIEKVDDKLWVVDDKRYYIQVTTAVKPIIESSGGISVLYLPLSSKVEWSVLW